MNSFSIFYLLPLFCVSFAPAQANRELCKLASASVTNSVNPGNSRTFTGSGIKLYKDDNATPAKVFFQVKDSGTKSEEFQMNPRTAVFIEKEIVARNHCVHVRLTLAGDPSTFYRTVFPLNEYPINFDVTQFTLDGKTLDISAIKVKPERGTWIFVAVSGNTPRLVFPSHRVKSMSHKIVHEEMTFEIEGDKNYSIFVEFDRLGDANNFHEYVDKTAP